MLNYGETPSRKEYIVPDLPVDIIENIQKIKTRYVQYVEDKQAVADRLGYQHFLIAYADLYLNKGESASIIGEKFSVCSSGVLHRLRKIKCPIRERGGNNYNGERFLEENRCASPMCAVLEKGINGKWSMRKTPLVDNHDGTLTCPKCKRIWRKK